MRGRRWYFDWRRGLVWGLAFELGKRKQGKRFLTDASEEWW
jgi:hypothetical protein